MTNVPYGDFLGIMLIPAGAMVFVLLKIVSDSRASNREINVAFEEDQGKDLEVPGKRALLEAAKRVRRLNDSVRMIKGLPSSTDEALSSLAGIQAGRNAGLAEPPGSADTNEFYGVFCAGARPYREVILKKLYESAINYGTYVLRNDMSSSSFFRENGIIPAADVPSRALRSLKDAKCLKAVAVDVSEERALASLFSRCSGPCASMLFNALNNAFEVIWC